LYGKVVQALDYWRSGGIEGAKSYLSPLGNFWPHPQISDHRDNPEYVNSVRLVDAWVKASSQVTNLDEFFNKMSGVDYFFKIFLGKD